MTRIDIKTITRLSPVGWVGAAMFVGAPAVAGYRYLAYIEVVERGLRYGVDTTFTSDFRGLMTLLIVATAVAAAGIVMVIAGRTHHHQVHLSNHGNN